MKNLYILIIILLITGCTSTLNIVNTSCPTYKNENFKKQDISKYGLAILPVFNDYNKEQYKKPMNIALNNNFKHVFNDSIILATNNVNAILNDNNLISSYSQLINEYNNTGIISKKLISELSTSLNVRYLLYSELKFDFKHSSKIDIYEYLINCQIWDSHISDVVWEGKGGVAITEASKIDIYNEIAKGLVNIVGSDNNEIKCNNENLIIESKAKSNGNFYFIGISLALLVLLITSL